ncbi:hypothetical protein, partial [uncultured Fibrobacter sp.]|uniref:hypothetical protein n=1 Tax=uncultured Fibrobacter sp. TaxID=261512 RepID=UPI0026008B16
LKVAALKVQGFNHFLDNKPKPNTAETILIVSIVEVLVYAIYRNTSRLRLIKSVRDHVDLKSAH